MSEGTAPAARASAAPIDGAEPATTRPPASRLILVRHGESTWNRERRIQGQLDPPLSEKGHEQARRVAGRLARGRIDALYTSDLLRASQTAAPIASALGVEARPMAGLREIFLGDWEGLHTDELAQRFPEAWDAWTREPSWDVVPRGEGATPFETRVTSVLDRLFEQHPQSNAIVVTHGGVIQIALHRVVGRPSHGLFPFRISNGSVSIVERRNGRMVIATVNDTSHLEGTPEE